MTNQLARTLFRAKLRKSADPVRETERLMRQFQARGRFDLVQECIDYLAVPMLAASVQCQQHPGRCSGPQLAFPVFNNPLSAPEVARILKCTPQHVRQLARAGRYPGAHQAPNGDWHIPAWSVHAASVTK